MADQPEEYEKTEEPTQRKLDEARRKGDVPKSQEVNSWFIMFGATLIVVLFAGNMARDLAVALKGFLGRAHDVPMDGGGLLTVMVDMLLGVGAALGLPILILVLCALGGNLVQNAPSMSVEPIKPKLSKISPIAGFKRLFSLTALVNFLKGVGKLLIVSATLALVLWGASDRLGLLVQLDTGSMLVFLQSTAGKLLGAVMAVLTILAALDFAYQRTTWLKKQRMTMKELRDEFKDMEGDPQVRAKLRQVRIERGRKRMMANVPNATVVVTNPTHYSIALQYEPGMSAPVCLAKGVDHVALKIREIAGEHDVPLVENPPLARALHASVEIDEEVPPEHYKAVAEIIGYVMRLSRAGKDD